MNTFSITVKPRLRIGITVRGNDVIVGITPAVESVGVQFSTPKPVMTITVRPRVQLSPTVRVREKFVVATGVLTPEQTVLLESITTIEQTANDALSQSELLALELEKIKQLTYAAL